MSQRKVVVIGGGVAGALTSIFLKQNGFSPSVYERVTTLNDIGVRIYQELFEHQSIQIKILFNLK
jgi:2-polyprenyl-6-methoxyphenol hydroxylase-like FAD-dependent oxidoreductase